MSTNDTPPIAFAVPPSVPEWLWQIATRIGADGYANEDERARVTCLAVEDAAVVLGGYVTHNTVQMGVDGHLVGQMRLQCLGYHFAVDWLRPGKIVFYHTAEPDDDAVPAQEFVTRWAKAFGDAHDARLQAVRPVADSSPTVTMSQADLLALADLIAEEVTQRILSALGDRLGGNPQESWRGPSR